MSTVSLLNFWLNKHRLDEHRDFFQKVSKLLTGTIWLHTCALWSICIFMHHKYRNKSISTSWHMWNSVWVFVQCPRSCFSVSRFHCGCGWAPTATFHTPHPPVCWSPVQLFAPVFPWWTITASGKRTEWTTSSNISPNSRMEDTNFFTFFFFFFRYTEFASKIIIIILYIL